MFQRIRFRNWQHIQLEWESRIDCFIQLRYWRHPELAWSADTGFCREPLLDGCSEQWIKSELCQRTLFRFWMCRGVPGGHCMWIPLNECMRLGPVMVSDGELSKMIKRARSLTDLSMLPPRSKFHEHFGRRNINDSVMINVQWLRQAVLVNEVSALIA